MEVRAVPQVIPNVTIISSECSRRILNSWKEIAQYMRIGVRTAQRYESNLGLPVHRVGGKIPSPVFAFCAEIDQWLMVSPTRNNILAARACTEFSSLLEALRTHAGSCIDCSTARVNDHDLARIAS